MKYLLVGLTCLVLSLSILSKVWAAGGDGGNDSSFEQVNENYVEGKKALQNHDYQKAIAALLKANEEEPNNADILNLLGYSHRKIKDWDQGLKYYLQALKIKPDHRDANEYLGELYLQMGQLSKAEERLKVLDDECFFGCKQFDELKEAIEKYKKNNT